MTDLHAGRGPKINRPAGTLLWLAVLLLLASHGVDPLGAPPPAKYAATGLGLIVLVTSIWLQRRSERRKKRQ